MRKIRERIREAYRKHTPSVKLPLIILTVVFCMIPLRMGILAVFGR